MAWRVVLVHVFVQCVVATFPAVSNPPPIPNQGVRTVDISGQRFYVQDNLQINSPQVVVKDESYLPQVPPDPKVDNQRWFVDENQSGETSDFPSSTETFDKYYSNGLPAVGPVATPVPDDSYIAQPSGTSKVLPNGSPNFGSSDIWVLAKGPDDQYVPQRWVQVQMPQERISKVVNADPQIVSGSVNPLPPPPIKSSGAPSIPTNILQQIWMRLPSQVQQQKVYQDTAAEVANIPVPKQNLDFSPQPVKQYVQTDVGQDPQQPFVSQPNIITQKSAGFVLPPPLPPTFNGGIIDPNPQNVVNQPAIYKGEDISSPKQTILVNQPDNYKGVDVSSPNQAVVVSQPLNYKGVDINNPNQPVLVNQPVNYKGADSSPPKTTFLVNQPQNYKGIDITSPKQSVIVNQPVNYKGLDIPSPNQDIVINQQSNYKGIDTNSPNQPVFINQPASYKGGYIGTQKQVPIVTQPQINVPLPKNNILVKHIWIPTSAQTGKFITVPVVGSAIDSGKSVPSKGVPINVPPVSVSGTWVLRQDGLLPRFEPQRTFSPQIIQKGSPSTGTVIQIGSPNNTPVFGKPSDSRVPVDIWANSKDFRTPSFVAKSVPPPYAAGRAGSVAIGKTGPVINITPQKTYISSNKGVPFQPIPSPAVAPVLQMPKGKPCITGPQKTLVSPNIAPYPVYRPSIALNRQSLPRILRINRYPYGSYYVLNPRIGPSVYAYPRPQASVVQQTKNGLVRIVSAKQIGVPQKQIYISVPQRQVAIPGNQIKTISPVIQPQFSFPAVEAFNRLRYAYPQGSFIRSLPAGGKNVFIFPPNRKTGPDFLQSSSSESSSSESSSSESKSAENKPKSKEEIGEAKSEASPESAEAKSERETEDVEAAASEPEPESKETSEVSPEATSDAAPEASESIETTDSEANSAS